MPRAVGLVLALLVVVPQRPSHADEPPPSPSLPTPPAVPAPATESLVSLPDPGYAEVRPQQKSALRPKIGRVIYPTLGLPALVHGGEGFDVWVRGVHATDVASWRVVLQTDALPTDGPQLALRPTKVEVDVEARVTHLRILVPITAPRDVYDLQVLGPEGLAERQPRAVRLAGPPSSTFRFALMADHQLWDPTWKIGKNHLSGGDFPMRGERDQNRAMARQGFHELELLDPDFVLYGGDLVFGLDYPAEMEEAWQMWSKNRFATFFVPGNHDGYARYDVRLKGSVVSLGVGLITCKNNLDGSLSWPKVWAYASCAYKDAKKNLFHNLIEDGLAYYQTMLGPPYYSFDYGKLHVIALNTYGGTPERRHSFSIYVDLFDLHLGAPAVDNYGGYLTDAQLTWLEADAQRAFAAGKTVLVFGHHDPRGNRELPPERRYHGNNPFPTDPISLEGFQEWNHDNAEWQSDPKGGRGAEKPDDHSGTRLLRILSKYASYVLLGHRHSDEHRVYQAGEDLAPNVKATRKIEFLRVTTAAGSTHNQSYWGYRLFDVIDGHIVDTRGYDAQHKLESLPAGNFWVEESESGGVLTAVSGLPQPVEMTLRFRLPARAEGWRFVDAGNPAVPLTLRRMAPLDGQNALYYVRFVGLPGPFPPRPGGATRRVLLAQLASGNRSPAPVIDVAPEPPVAGARALVSAERSVDPDGDALLEFRWTLPGGEVRRERSFTYTFPTVGTFPLALELVDARGARGRVERTVDVVAPPRPQGEVAVRRGCGCALAAGESAEGEGAVDGGALLPAALLVVVGALVSRRRGRRGTQRE